MHLREKYHQSLSSTSEKYLFESKSNKPNRDNQIKYRILLHFDFESTA